MCYYQPYMPVAMMRPTPVVYVAPQLQMPPPPPPPAMYMMNFVPVPVSVPVIPIVPVVPVVQSYAWYKPCPPQEVKTQEKQLQERKKVEIEIVEVEDKATQTDFPEE
ncbi:hypothetical protein NPX13_g9051 [Xylaria arbuscula]|uniref:Uncharacterized protein n=1 Tax=Xylaria arbuscula TaxID=114810 RepID=A0A9W8TI19_9PEZI|nr:hypothetical protein NPX13_g9051 [Xylaria arbuscula]